MGQCWNLLPVPAMVQGFGDLCSNGAVLLLKMVVCGGVATWNAGFLSQRCR